jgi:hypothetical protein
MFNPIGDQSGSLLLHLRDEARQSIALMNPSAGYDSGGCPAFSQQTLHPEVITGVELSYLEIRHVVTRPTAGHWFAGLAEP